MLRVYDTLTKKKKPLRKSPITKGHFGLFVCGPTVYDFAHIGHARTYIAFDFIAKYLRFRGFSNLYYVQNITDIDDKIIERAIKSRTTARRLAQKFTQEYLRDIKALDINSVDAYAPATKFIPEIISQVERLIKNGFAYKIHGDGIYFNIKKFPSYGKLSGRTAAQAEDAVTRIDENIKKINKGDFCLWKLSKKSEPSWNSPMGRGRPGWHIEDTAISEKFLGPQYQIHGGARDLIFPHHESEIAQMEAISGKVPIVNTWMHTGFLTMAGEKMSKSLGNFVTIRDFLKKHPPEIIRYLVLSRHYSSPVDFSNKLIKQTKKSLDRLRQFTGSIRNPSMKKSAEKAPNNAALKRLRIDFYSSLDDDLNTPNALAHLFKFIRSYNKSPQIVSSEGKVFLAGFFREIDSIFGFELLKNEVVKVPLDILKLARARQNHRTSKQWLKADELRKKMEKLGWQVADTPSGPKIEPVNQSNTQKL